MLKKKGRSLPFLTREHYSSNSQHQHMNQRECPSHIFGATGLSFYLLVSKSEDHFKNCAMPFDIYI